MQLLLGAGVGEQCNAENASKQNLKALQIKGREPLCSSWRFTC